MVINNINNHRVCIGYMTIIIELVSFDSTSHVDIAETSNNILGCIYNNTQLWLVESNDTYSVNIPAFSS